MSTNSWLMKLLTQDIVVQLVCQLIACNFWPAQLPIVSKQLTLVSKQLTLVSKQLILVSKELTNVHKQLTHVNKKLTDANKQLKNVNKQLTIQTYSLQLVCCKINSWPQQTCCMTADCLHFLLSWTMSTNSWQISTNSWQMPTNSLFAAKLTADSKIAACQLIVYISRSAELCQQTAVVVLGAFSGA